MNKLIILATLPLWLAAAGAQAQCVSGQNCGQGGSTYGDKPSNSLTADQSRDLCFQHLADMATVMLKASLANSTALNAKGRASEAITVAEIKANAASVSACSKYGQDHSDWSQYGAASVYYTSEPAHSLQQKWNNQPEPQMPDAGQFRNFYPTETFFVWCPTPAQSGPVGDIGNGPNRVTSKIDDLAVCAQSAAATTVLDPPYKLMQFAQGCGKYFEPDALLRYQQEMACMNAAEANAPQAKQPVGANPAIINTGAIPPGPTPPAVGPVKKKGP